MIKEFEKGVNEYNKPFLISDNTKTVPNKKISISKPKGDIDMKNIVWRPKEKRYIGRKQVDKNIIVVYGKTQKECLEKLNKKIKELKSDYSNAVKTKTNSFINCWNKWYQQNKEPFIADSTKDDFKIITKKLKPLYDISLKNLNKDKLLEYFEKLENNRTKDKIVTQLKSFFKYATLERIINNNPFNTIIYKNKKFKSKPAFTYEQQIAILENLENKVFKPIILFFLVTGIRKNEIDFQNIENCIDRDKNILTIINLKGRDRQERFKKIKLSNQAKNMVLNNLNVFHKYTNRLIADHFKDFLKKINIKGSLVNCRHTFATNCFYLGKDTLIISREMGHTTSQITKDNYIDIDYNLSKEKILKLYKGLYNLE